MNPVPPPNQLNQGIRMENVFVRILTLPLAFTVRIPSQEIFLPFVMSEWFEKKLLSESPCIVR